MSRISRRLFAAIEEIGKVDTLADIGTDHGQLIIYALENSITERAFAVDISKKSLLKAQNAIADKNLLDKVQFFLGDGVKPLPITPNAVVIAGIGGYETVKIIRDRPLNTKYVCIPHNDPDVLRRYFNDNGFKIIKDYIIKDSKFYAIIVAVKGKNNYTETQILLGANNPPTHEYLEKLAERKRQIENIIKKEKTELNLLKPEIQIEYEEICKCIK